MPQEATKAQVQEKPAKPWTVVDRAAHELEKMANDEKAHVAEIRRSIGIAQKSQKDVSDLVDQSRVFELLEHGYREGAKAVKALGVKK